MHRGLLVFSIFVILAGIFAGVLFVPVIGLFLLFAALLTPGSQSTTRQRAPIGTYTPPPPPPETPSYSMESTREPATTQYISTSATPTQPSGYEQRTAAGSPAMFPGTMFPSFMQPQQVLQPMQGAQPAPQEAEKKMAGKESRDELVELAAILMALRLVSR